MSVIYILDENHFHENAGPISDHKLSLVPPMWSKRNGTKLNIILVHRSSVCSHCMTFVVLLAVESATHFFPQVNECLSKRLAT